MERLFTPPSHPAVCLPSSLHLELLHSRPRQLLSIALARPGWGQAQRARLRVWWVKAKAVEC